MQARLLICDLDNTLYDWVSYFVTSFYAMVDEVVRLTGCNREALLDDFRAVHQRHHDSEHPFALLETATVRDIYPHLGTDELARMLDPAFHAFNSRRKETLFLYPGVRETLKILDQAGVTLVAHTESKLFAVIDRLDRLGLARTFKHIYCRERTDTQRPSSARRWGPLDSFPMETVVELRHHQRKPNPEVLFEICRDEGIDVSQAAYIGDSMTRDITMAKKAGMFSIWAKYGTEHNASEYEALVRVSHWTADDIEREKQLHLEASSVHADFIAEQSFDEVLTALGVNHGLTPSRQRR